MHPLISIKEGSLSKRKEWSDLIVAIVCCNGIDRIAGNELQIPIPSVPIDRVVTTYLVPNNTKSNHDRYHWLNGMAQALPGADENDERLMERHKQLTHTRRMRAKDSIYTLKLIIFGVNLVEVSTDGIRAGREVDSIDSIDYLEICLTAFRQMTVRTEGLIDHARVEIVRHDRLQVGDG